MASNDLGFNDAKLAWGNWDYVDLSPFTKMPGTSITASALSLVKGCGEKAQHPGILAGVASFSAGIALHRMRRGHGKRTRECVGIVGPLPAPKVISTKTKEQNSWLPIFFKGAGATCLMFAASRQVRKRWKHALAAKNFKLAGTRANGSSKLQESLHSVSTKAPSSTSNSLASCASRGRAAERSSRARSIPSFQMKFGSKCVEEDGGKVALPIMHFKRIHCFEDASPFSSNGPTRSPSPGRKEQAQEGDTPLSGSPDPSQKGKGIVEDSPSTEQAGRKEELVQVQTRPSDKKEQVPKTGTASPSKPRDMQEKPEEARSPRSPTSPMKQSLPSSPEKQVQGSQAAQPASAAAKAPGKPADKQSPSPRNQPRAPDGRPVDKQIQSSHDSHAMAVVGEKQHLRKQDLPSKGILQDPTPAPRQPSQASSSSGPTAQKAQNSKGAVNGPGAGAVAQTGNQLPVLADAKRVLPKVGDQAQFKPPPAPAKGEKVPPAPAKSNAQHHHAPREGSERWHHKHQIEYTDGRTDRPAPGASAPRNSAGSSASARSSQDSTKPSPRPPTGPSAPSAPRTPQVPASSGKGPEPGRPSGLQSQRGLPPKAEASSSSAGANKSRPQSSSSRPGRSGSLATQDSDDDLYSVYSYTTESSSISRDGRGRHSRSRSDSSLSDGSRSRSPSSGRHRGNEFLPDISVQVGPSDEPGESHANQARADDLCEFHVMHDEDAAAPPGGSSLQQEYDQTLRRLGARRAPASQGLRRQVTD